MRNAATCAKLRANTDPAKIHAILSIARNPAAA
jgi:hypothetical protein